MVETPTASLILREPGIRGAMHSADCTMIGRSYSRLFLGGFLWSAYGHTDRPGSGFRNLEWLRSGAFRIGRAIHNIRLN